MQELDTQEISKQTEKLGKAIERLDLETVENITRTFPQTVNFISGDGSAIHAVCGFISGGMVAYHNNDWGNREKILDLLIERGADLSAKTKYNSYSPLHLALKDWWVQDQQDPRSIDSAIIIKLIKHGADINAADRRGDTPLMMIFTKFCNRAYMVALLIEHGADVTVKNKIGKTVLHLFFKNSDLIAQRHGREQCLTYLFMLIEAGASLYTNSNDEYTPLDYSRWYCHDVFILQRLYATLPTDFKFKENGDTVLHLHRMLDSEQYVRALANKGFSVNAKNTNGDTPLHIAGRYKRLDGADMLLRCGADPSIPNKKGITPLQEAKKNKCPKLHDALSMRIQDFRLLFTLEDVRRKITPDVIHNTKPSELRSLLLDFFKLNLDLRSKILGFICISPIVDAGTKQIKGYSPENAVRIYNRLSTISFWYKPRDQLAAEYKKLWDTMMQFYDADDHRYYFNNLKIVEAADHLLDIMCVDQITSPAKMPYSNKLLGIYSTNYNMKILIYSRVYNRYLNKDCHTLHKFLCDETFQDFRKSFALLALKQKLTQGARLPVIADDINSKLQNWYNAAVEFDKTIPYILTQNGIITIKKPDVPIPEQADGCRIS